MLLPTTFVTFTASRMREELLECLVTNKNTTKMQLSLSEFYYFSKF